MEEMNGTIHSEPKELTGSRELRRDYKERKDSLKQDYKEQKQEIKAYKEASMTNVKGRIKTHMSGFLHAIIVGLLVLVQFLIILYLPLFLHQYTVIFYAVLEAFSFFVAVGLTNANKNASYKVAWLSIALLLPVSGHVMYFLWGRKNPRKKRIERTLARFEESFPYIHDNPEVNKELEETIPAAVKMSRYMGYFKFPLYKNTKMKYYPMGEDTFRDIFDDIAAAKKYVFLNFFIVAEGALWDMLHEILIEKVQEGVEIVFIYDDFGAMFRTDKEFCERLNKEGIRTMVFNPIHRYTDKIIMNYRTHQKIVVIDGEIGYTGGFNIADEYANLIQRFGTWKDCGIRLEGDGVWGLAMTFLQMWSICDRKATMNYQKYKSDVRFPTSDAFCHAISDGPIQQDENVIESVYKQIISDAEKFVYIMTPYLILEEHMVLTLVEAVKRGVDVRIITPNIPDKKQIKLLTNYNYGPLLKEGVKIYEYTPGFIHSKVIINEFCGVVGTVNMDYRSFYLHYENAVWACNSSVLIDIYEDFIETFRESAEYTYEEWLNRPVRYKIYQPLLNLLSTLV